MEYRKLAKIMGNNERAHIVLEIKDSTIKILDETILAKDKLNTIANNKILEREAELKKQNRIILRYRIGITALAIVSVALLFN